MSLCLDSQTGLLVYTSGSALTLALDGFVLYWIVLGIDPKYKGGSVRMAAASAVIDQGVPIDVVLNKGRWANWQVFTRFYNCAYLRVMAPSISLTSLA